MTELTSAVPGAGTDDRPPQLRQAIRVGVVVGVPASVLFLYLALRHVQAHAVVAAVRDASAPLVLVAVAAMGLVYLAQAYRWRCISRLGPTMPTLRFFDYVLRSIACNNVVPGRPGELLRAHWLARGAGVSRSRALATVAVDRSADVLTLVLALAVTYGFVDHPRWLRRLDGAALGLAALLLCLLFVARYRARGRGDAPRPSRIRRIAGDVAAGVAHGLAGRNGLVVASTSALAWSAWAAGAWLVAHALGLNLSIGGALFVTATLNLGSMIPSSPGFVGTYQWLSVASLGLLGIARTDAVAFSLLMQAVWFVPTTIVGGCLALRAGLSCVIFNPAKAVKAHA
jgi:uncharacterized protein (TIRG00374 family)